MRIPTLTTQRLTIRELTMDDLPAVNALYGKDKTDWLRWTTLSYVQFTAIGQPTYGERAVTLTATGMFLGLLGVVPSYGPFGALPHFVAQANGSIDRRNRPEVGLYYEFLPEQRGQGYATEAVRSLVDYLFRQWHLSRVIATTTDDNDRSIALMQRIGMTIERYPYQQPEWFQTIGILENQ